MGKVQVYDLKFDADQIRNIQRASSDPQSKAGLSTRHGLFGSAEWWSNVERGTLPIISIQGKISDVYMAGHDDWAEFEIDREGEKTHWARDVSETQDTRLSREEKLSAYKEGRTVTLSYVEEEFKTFEGHCRCVLGIWIYLDGT